MIIAMFARLWRPWLDEWAQGKRVVRVTGWRTCVLDSGDYQVAAKMLVWPWERPPNSIGPAIQVQRIF